MKNKRQNAILDLIREECIDTQELLQERLAERGFSVTQATVSRDIRELNLVKSLGDDGIYCYRTDFARRKEAMPESMVTILQHAVLSVEAANNLLVVKTRTGMGNAVGAAVDALAPAGCIGTLAGDDTLLLIAKTNDAADDICSTLLKLIKKGL